MRDRREWAWIEARTLQGGAIVREARHPRFPCEPGGKGPLTYNGLWDATTDLGQVKTWWGRWPDSNVGVPTGKRSGLLVLDVDPRNGGPQSLVALELDNGPLRSTGRVAYWRGGVHVFRTRHEEGDLRNWSKSRDGARANPTSVRNEARGHIWPSYPGKKRGPSAASTPFRTVSLGSSVNRTRMLLLCY